MTDWQHERHRFAYENEAKMIADNFPDKNVKGLDIGCGTGYGSKILAGVANEVIGLDNNSAILPDDPNFRCWDVIPDDIPPSVDVIVANQFIEHLQEPALFLRKVSNSLKPGGMFFVSTPNQDFRLRPGEKPHNNQHTKEYGLLEFRHLLNEFFDDLSVYGVFAQKEIAKWEILRRVRIAISLYDPPGLWANEKIVENLFSRIRPHVNAAIDEHNPAELDNPFDFRLTNLGDFPLDLVGIVHKEKGKI